MMRGRGPRRCGRAALALALVLLAACTSREDRVLFGGHYFRAKAEAVDRRGDRTRFRVTVPDVAVSLEDAVQAGAYEATRYCIANYGSSRILWEIGPDTEPRQLPIEKGRLTLQGTCIRP